MSIDMAKSHLALASRAADFETTSFMIVVKADPDGAVYRCG